MKKHYLITVNQQQTTHKINSSIYYEHSLFIFTLTGTLWLYTTGLKYIMIVIWGRNCTSIELYFHGFCSVAITDNSNNTHPPLPFQMLCMVKAGGTQDQTKFLVIHRPHVGDSKAFLDLCWPGHAEGSVNWQHGHDFKEIQHDIPTSCDLFNYPAISFWMLPGNLRSILNVTCWHE